MQIDAGKKLDWGQTSADYAVHRPGPPQSLYQKSRTHGIGFKGQKILDLGTGTGLVARALAGNDAIVAGIDKSEQQIKTAIMPCRASATGGVLNPCEELRG